MGKSTLKTWKKLQSEGYFENHPLYDCQTIGIPHCVDIKDISGKTVIDFGCGYGRDTKFFRKFANHVFAVDVSEEILVKAYNFVYNGEDILPVDFVLAEDLDCIQNTSVDYVYALHVFQHLSPEQAEEYIKVFHNKLVLDGRLMIQFYLGKDKMMDEGKEPRVQYTTEEAYKLFKSAGFKIDRTWVLQKMDAKEHLQYEHLYIVGRK